MRIRFLPLVLLGFAACDNIPAPEAEANEEGQKEQNLMRLANGTREAGDYVTAAELYRQAAAISQGDVAPHLALSALYRRMKQPDAALAVLEDAKKLQPKNAEVQSALGAALIAAGQPEQALNAYNAALALSPDNAEAYNGKGVALDNLNRHAEAQAAYRQAIANGGDTPALRNNLALSLVLSGDYAEAISMLKKLAASAGATPTMRQNLALAYGLSGDRAKALAMGMRDLSPDQARENVKFYTYYRGAQEASAPAEMAAPVTPVEASAPESAQ